MAKWQWAALWKRAAKKQRHEADRYFIAWMKAVVQLGRRGRQAKAWKRAAKNYRAMFRLCALTSVPLWKERYWAARRSARAWKGAAKKYRFAFRLCVLTSVPPWKYWVAWRSARAWKAVAKIWRRKALDGQKGEEG